MKLNKKFFSRSADIVARDLLGKILCRKMGSFWVFLLEKEKLQCKRKLKQETTMVEKTKIARAKIVETEAYFGSEDPASRARQNGDLRKTMLMEPATILTYGVHNNWLINFVANDKGKAEAVLLRALEPLNFNENTKGPGLLTKALKINKEFHKKSICDNKDIWLEENKENEKFEIVKSFRIGVKKDLSEKLRFYIKGNEWVSRK